MKNLKTFLLVISSILFTGTLSAANRYWIATATANWNSTANWSTTSGGAGGASVPGSADVAIFNAAKVGSCTINANVNVLGVSIISGYTGTISQGTYTVAVGTTGYSQAAGTFSGGSGAMTAVVFTLSGGTFTAPSTTLKAGTPVGNATIFTHSGGTFNHNNGTVNFAVNSSTSTYTVDVITATLFYKVAANFSTSLGNNSILGTATNDTVKIVNDFTHSTSTLNGKWRVQGNLIVNTGANGGTGNIILYGTGNQTYSYSTGRTCNLVINKSSGTVSQAGGTTNLSVQGFKLVVGTFTAPSANFYIGGTLAANTTVFDHTAGTFTHNSGTTIFDMNGAFTFTIKTLNTTNFNHVTINSSGTHVLQNATDTLRVNNLTLQQGTFNTGLIQVKGNATITNTYGGTGKIAFMGTVDQNFTLTGATDKFNVTNLIIKQSPGKKVVLQSAAILDQSGQSITFTRGNILSTASNLLTIGHGVTVSGASYASYVDGPVKKTGNAAFTFPVGKNGQYRSIVMSAPTNTTDAYTGEYFWDNSNSTYSHSSKDAGIAQLSRSEYWKLDRNVGTSNVSVTLSWESATSCGFTSTANLKVAAWDGATWKDKGNGGVTGNTTAGTIVTNGVSTTYGAYSLATTATFDCYCWDATAMGSGNNCMNSQTLTTTERWYKFTADSSKVEIKVKNLSSSPVIEWLYIYTSCSGGYLLARDSIAIGGDTVLICSPRNLTIGGTYYAKVTKSVSGSASFNICKTNRAPNTFIPLYPGVNDPASACGLKYNQRSVRMNQRVHAPTGAGISPPITFDFRNTVPALPNDIPANAVLEKAYLWFSTVGTHSGASAYIPDVDIDYNIQTSNQNVNCLVPGGIARSAPLLVNSNINNNNDDNGTCWGGYTTYAGMQITCTYFDDLTNHFIANNFMEGLNQIYTISNLPAINNNFDITGATLMLLYRTPCTASTNPSRIVIQHGLDVVRDAGFFSLVGYNLNGLGAFAQNTNEQAFMIVEDFENNIATYDMFNPGQFPPGGFNGLIPINGMMHNFIESSTVVGNLGAFNANQASLNYMLDQNGIGGQSNDCFAVTMMGAYTENADPAATCTPIAIDIVPIDNCNTNNTYTLNSTLTGGAPAVTFGWGPTANITGSLVTQNTTGTAATPVNFYVTATGNDGCKDVDYTVVAHCEEAAQTYNICGTNNTATAFLNQLGNPAGNLVTVPNGIILINSLFTVDHDINFETCPQIRLSPNARIVVNPGFTLTLKACTLRVCENYMWDGIYLSTSGSLVSKLVAGGSQFEQAINAVVSDAGGNYDISSCTFLDCHIGIRVQNYNPSGSPAHPGKVTGTTFIQSGTLLPPYCGEPFFAGIDVYAVDDLTIGNNSNTLNTFNTIRYGVRAERSDVTLSNNLFTNVGNMQVPPFIPSAIPERGAVVTWSPIFQIFNVIDSKISVLGNGLTVHNSFTNCNIGVFAVFQPAIITNGNVFTNVTTGVRLIESQNALVAGASSTWGNTFTNSNVGTAIRIEDVFQLARNEQVYFNTISGHQTGIFALQTTGTRIQENAVNFSTAGATTRGIRAESTRNSIIHLNTVTHTTTPIEGGFRFGILSTLNTAPIISHNTLTKMGSGIVGQAVNANSTLACNHHVTGYHGFNFQAILGSSSVTIGNQVWLPPSGLTTPFAMRATGNDWTTMVSGGWRIRGGVIPTGTQWYWAGAAFSITDPSPNSVTGLSFFQPPAGTASPCPYTPAMPPVDTTQRRVLFQQIVLDTANLGAYAEGIRYYQKEYVYRTFRETPAWLTLNAGSNAPYSDFYNTLKATNLETFILAEDTAFDGAVNYAITLNNSISPVNSIETNRKTVNTIFFNTWAQGIFELSKADSITLAGIAYLHALSNGPGVYTARVMLGLDIEDSYEGSSKTDDEMSSGPYEEVPRFTKIYPNPNSGQMQMDYQLPQGSSGIIQVLDFSGRELQLLNLYQGLNTMQINLSEFGSGIYFGRIFVNDEYLYSEKIILME